MRPARKGPETQVAGKTVNWAVAASMRPARKGPETVVRHLPHQVRVRRFNEAGPQGAGNGGNRTMKTPPTYTASMRPARKGPETSRSSAAAGITAAMLQ